MEKSSAPDTPRLVSHDFTEETSDTLPPSLTEAGKLVFWNGTPNFNKVSVLLNAGSEVKPGQFLAVWHGRRNSHFLTIIQVSNCFEVNPSEDPQLSAARDRLGLSPGYAGEGVSTRIYRIAECDTIEEFEVEPLGPLGWRLLRSRSPEALGRAGDPVVLVPPELSHEVIGSLPEESQGIHLGKTYGANPVNVTFKPEMFQMHIGIFGNPGKGKSYSGGAMLEEAYSWGIPILVLDVNGEMGKTAEALKGLVITLPDPRQFGLSLSLLTPPELVSITPNVRPNTQYGELIELAHDQLKNEYHGGAITFPMLKDRINKLGQDLSTVKTSVGAAISRISVLEKDPLIGANFDFIKMLERHGIVVLDCRFLSLRQTQLIAAAAARVLQTHGWKMARKAAEKGDQKAGEWFSLFFVDEAHAIVPNDDEVVSTQVLYELARMGRHVRTGLILSSQSPSDLDLSVLKRLQTRFIFALEKDQLRAIGGVTADISDDILGQLPKLPRGVCAVSGSSELVRHGFLLEVRQRVTPVGGSTPPVFKSRSKRPL